MHRVHYFASSAQAYDASLDAGPVREGDILVIDAERIVGLTSADPIAITTESGALKAFAPMDRESLLGELVHDADTIGRAVDEALRHRLPVADHFLGFAGPSHVVLPSELSIGVQKGPPIGVQKGPPSSSSVTGMTGALFALVAA